jgi:hypothetical protein
MRSATLGTGVTRMNVDDRRRERRRGVSGIDPRLSRAVTAHSLVVAGLSVVHSLRASGLRRTLLFAAFWGTPY